jgi:PAS domain
VTNVILSISDITERKKTEEALRESEERFRTLVENLHVGVALMGPRAEILFANNAALEIFGLSQKQVIGKTSEELGFMALREDGTELPFAMRPAPRALATGQAVRSESSVGNVRERMKSFGSSVKLCPFPAKKASQTDSSPPSATLLNARRPKKRSTNFPPACCDFRTRNAAD